MSSRALATAALLAVLGCTACDSGPGGPDPAAVVGADAALVDVTAYFRRAGRRQQSFGEIGDLRDVRVLGRVGR